MSRNPSPRRSPVDMFFSPRKMRWAKFNYAVAGGFVAWLVTYANFKIGQQHTLDIIFAILVLSVVLWVWRKLQHDKPLQSSFDDILSGRPDPTEAELDEFTPGTVWGRRGHSRREIDDAVHVTRMGKQFG